MLEDNSLIIDSEDTLTCPRTTINVWSSIWNHGHPTVLKCLFENHRSNPNQVSPLTRVSIPSLVQAYHLKTLDPTKYTHKGTLQILLSNHQKLVSSNGSVYPHGNNCSFGSIITYFCRRNITRYTRLMHPRPCKHTPHCSTRIYAPNVPTTRTK